MLRYIARRFFSYIPLFLGITILSFLIVKLAPGGPEAMIEFGAARVDPQAAVKLKKIYGLDKPLIAQYVGWLKNIVKLDFGVSFQDGEKVSRKIFQRLPATLLLNVCSIVVIFFIAIVIGVWSAARYGSFFDNLMTVVVFMGFSVPAYWLALIAMDWLGVRAGILPVSGMVSVGWENFSLIQKILDVIWHLILPVFISAFTSLAALTRYVKAEMLDVLSRDYILACKARGLSEKEIIWKEAFPNALLPVATIAGLMLPSLISGSVIFETIFSWPGVGRLMWQAVMARDYPVILGNGIFITVLTLLGNFLADISYAWLDPRIRYG